MKDVLYGLLSYKTNNVGDEIQSLAALQFLPRVDLYLDRDNLKNVRSKKKIKLILNGWFNPKPSNWPPSDDIDPLFISFHVSERAVQELASPASLAYLQKHQPIGCRDVFTQKILGKNGVKAYFSGCLTLTLKNMLLDRSDEIVIADLNQEAKMALPKELQSQAIYTEHWSYPKYARRVAGFIYYGLKTLRLILRKLRINKLVWSFLGKIKSREKAFKQAVSLLETYAGAKLVLTSRLHAALPCLAFDTPVIFIHSAFKDPRFEGWFPYLRHVSLEDLGSGKEKILWRNPLPNPRDISPLRETLTKTCKKFIKG